MDNERYGKQLKASRKNLVRTLGGYIKIRISFMARVIVPTFGTIIYLILIALLLFSIITGSVFSIYDEKIREVARYYGIFGDDGFNDFSSMIYAAYIVALVVVELYLICVIIRRMKKKRSLNYTASDIALSYSNNNYRSALSCMKNYINKITNNRDIDTSTRYFLEDDICRRVEPIVDFIMGNDNTLVINGRWGSGKTSLTLLAIEQADHRYTGSQYRYVAESAFKYVRGVSEFKNDIIETIEYILARQGIKVRRYFDELVVNIGKNKLNIDGVLASRRDESYLTTDIIHNINKKYKKGDFYIVLIIDDVDRLIGDDVIDVLSFISILRRLEFMKIILPLDRHEVEAQLGRLGVSNPNLFLKKYLPEHTELKISNQFNNAKELIINSFRYTKGNDELSKSQLDALLNIVFIRLLSNKLKAAMEAANVSELNEWLLSDYGELSTKLGQSKAILKAKDYMVRYINKDYGESLTFRPGVYGLNDFEDILFSVAGENARYGSIRFVFDKELYKKYILSWLLKFVDAEWNNLDINMRDVIDALYEVRAKVVYDAIDEKDAGYFVFAKTFNRVFSGKKIRLMTTKDEED